MKNLFFKTYSCLFFITLISLNFYQSIDTAPTATIAGLLENKKSISFKSSEGEIESFQFDLLTADCIARLKRLDSSLIDDTIITTNYSKNLLGIVRTFLVYQKNPASNGDLPYASYQALVDKVAEYLTDAGDKTLFKAQQLGRALVFFGLNDNYLSGALNQCKEKLKCEEKEILYTYKDFYAELQEENMKSVTDGQPAEVDAKACYARKQFNNILFMPEQQRRRLAFKVVSSNAKSSPEVSLEYIMDAKSRQDLEIICGPKSAPAHSLASAIDCTSSELGKVFLYSQLLQPTCDIATLEKRQEITCALLLCKDENPEVFEELDNLLTNFFKEKKYENNLLAFWDVGYFDQVTNYPKYSDKKSQELSNWLQDNEVVVEVSEGLSFMTFMIIDAAGKAVSKMLPIKWIYENIPYAEFFIKALPSMFGCAKSKPTKYIENYVKESLKNSNLSPQIIGTTAENIGMTTVGNFSLLLRSMVESDEEFGVNNYVQDMAAQFRCQQERLILLAEYIKFMQNVAKCIDKLPELKEVLPELATLDLKAQSSSFFSYFAQEYSAPGSFDQFLNKLYSVHEDKDSYWKQYHLGRILATHRLAYQHKEVLLPSIMALAQLDMYLSLARLKIKNEKEGNPFELVDFVDINESGAPLLELTGFWSPTVKANPVTNTLMLGNGNPKNVVITGPNTGGKSTTMRGMAYSALMAQTFGWVPAEGMEFTPFSTIRAYLNITDDPAKGASLFKCSVQRASELTSKAKASSGCSLTLFDELYNGTNPQAGESLAYATLNELGTSDAYERNVCVATTHFACVNKLAEDPCVDFSYYRVASKDDGEENRFKILPGISTTFNAFEVAQEVELDEPILEKAEEYYGDKFADSPVLSLLLDMLESNLLNEKIIKKYFRHFATLVLTSEYSERFFNFAQEHQLDLKKILNHRDDKGRTILHYAAIWDIKNPALIEQLIAKGARPSLKDKFGKSAQNCAYEGSMMSQTLHEETGKLLKAHSFKLLHTLKGNTTEGLYYDGIDEPGYCDAVNAVAIADDIFVICSKDAVRVYDKVTGNHLFNLEGYTGNITCVAIAKDIIAIGSDDGSARVYQRDGQYKFNLEGDDTRILAIDIGDGVIVTKRSGKDTIEVYDKDNGQSSGEIEDKLANQAIAQDFDMNKGITILYSAMAHNFVIASGTNCNTRVYYDADDGEFPYLFNLDGHSQRATAMAVSDSFIAVGSADKVIRLYNIENGEFITAFGDVKYSGGGLIKSLAIHENTLIAGCLGGKAFIYQLPI